MSKLHGRNKRIKSENQNHELEISRGALKYLLCGYICDLEFNQPRHVNQSELFI